MKNKFERLTKEEQASAIEEYKNSSEVGANVVKRLKRTRTIALLGIIYSVILFISNFITHAAVYEFILAAGVLVACTILFVKSKDVLHNTVNKYLVNQMRNKQKEEYKKEQKKNN